jgi:hypothetical protein
MNYAMLTARSRAKPVRPVITITSQPVSQTLPANTFGQATFSVSASVAGGGVLSYRWEFSDSESGEYVDMSELFGSDPSWIGASTPVLQVQTLNGEPAGVWQYLRVVISYPGAVAVISNVVNLTFV